MFLTIIIILSATCFAGVSFVVYQPGENHAPRASNTQVNYPVHTLSNFLRNCADPGLQIFCVFVTVSSSL